MTFLKQLRDAAAQCSNVDYRALLRTAADDVDIALSVLARDPTLANMRDLNGKWALASRVLTLIPPEGDPAPLSGSPEPARLAA